MCLPERGEDMTIYVAGPMTGLPGLNFDAFYAAEQVLQEQGHRVLNPARIGVIDGFRNWRDYWPLNEAMLRGADAVYMLRGWENSPGAFREHAWATENGLTVLKEGGDGALTLQIPGERRKER